MTDVAADAPEAHCRNCGNFLGIPAGKYCPTCGQETTNHPPTLWEFLHEFTTHYVALEGKLWRTLRMLFFKPGALTTEFFAGRRARYIAPLRLYITASFLFFLLVKFVGWGNLIHTEVKSDAAAASAVTVSRSNTTEKPGNELVAEAMQSSLADMKWDCGFEGLCRRIKARLAEKYTGKTGKDIVQEWKSSAFANVPYALFLFLPIFALATKLLYLKRGRTYGEHLVYALHVHAFTFFILLLKAVLPRYLGDVVSLLAFVYYFLAMQRVFGGRWWATGLRFVFIGSVYPLSLLLVSAALVLLV